MKCEACWHENRPKPSTVNGIEYGCTCPSYLREEMEDPGDETFYPRTGCMTCDRWDEPPQSRDR